MKYVIKATYSVRLEYKDFETFTSEIGYLIEGGLKAFEIVIEDGEEEEEEES